MMPVFYPFGASAGAAPLDVTLRRGDTLTQDLSLVDAVGDPLNVTGWTWLSQVRDQADADAVVATVTVVVTDASAGALTIQLSAADSAGLSGRYVWDLQGDNAGDVTTVAAGLFDVPADVSRA